VASALRRLVMTRWTTTPSVEHRSRRDSACRRWARGREHRPGRTSGMRKWGSSSSGPAAQPSAALHSAGRTWLRSIWCDTHRRPGPSAPVRRFGRRGSWRGGTPTWGLGPRPQRHRRPGGRATYVVAAGSPDGEHHRPRPAQRRQAAPAGRRGLGDGRARSDCSTVGSLANGSWAEPCVHCSAPASAGPPSMPGRNLAARISRRPSSRWSRPPSNGVAVERCHAVLVLVRRSRRHPCHRFPPERGDRTRGRGRAPRRRDGRVVVRSPTCP
jgi:hypothetical protein